MLSCRLLYSQKCRHILRIPCWIRKDILWVHFSGLVAYIYFNRRMHYGNGGLEYFWRCFFANAGTGGNIPFSESSSLERTAHPHQSLLSEVNNKNCYDVTNLVRWQMQGKILSWLSQWTHGSKDSIVCLGDKAILNLAHRCRRTIYWWFGLK